MTRTLPFVVLALPLLGCPSQSPEPSDDDDAVAPEPCDPWVEDAPPTPLADIAIDVGLQDRHTVNNGMAAADFNGDGRLDLYLANPGPPSALMLQQEDGSFRAVTQVPTSGNDTGPAAVDYDGDGDPDLYLSCGFWERGCASRLFRNDGVLGNGEPIFTDVTAEAGLYDPEVSNFGGAWADMDGDGDLDLFQGCKYLRAAPSVPSADQLYRNNGDGTFTEIGEAAGVDSVGDSHQAVWLDFNEDGYPDLFVPVLAGPNLLYRNRGDGTFEDVTPEMMVQPFTAFAALASDFDNDGHTDILVSGRDGPEMGNLPYPPFHGLFLSDGAGGWTDASRTTGLNGPGDSATDIATMGLQVGDLDLDGFPEVVFGNGSPGAGSINALGSFAPGPDGLRWIDRTELIDTPSPEDGTTGYPDYPYRSHGMGFFDLDGDRDIDLFIGNGGGVTAEPNRMWRNDQSGPVHGLTVRLRGKDGNSTGVGAKVRVADGPEGESTWAVFRDYWPSSGFNSWLPPELSIGTGHCDGPFHVTVRWPDGSESTLEDVPEWTDLEIEQP